MLWEALASKPDEEIETKESTRAYTLAKFKNDTLIKIGAVGEHEDAVDFGCPFCEKYFCSMECPIHYCYETPYKQYEKEFVAWGHKQEEADMFYRFMVKRAIEEGYEPEVKFKYWD